MPDGETPRGYGLYKALQRLRFPGMRVHLSQEAYAKDPWRAFEIAMGLKPKKIVKDIRSLRREQYRAARE